MGKGKALDELTKQQVIYLWMNKNNTQAQIANRLGIGTTTVKRIISEYVETGAHQPPDHMDIPKQTQINPEFDAAVDAMIAESKAADAEEPSAITEPEKLPGVVRRALDVGYAHLLDEIAERREQIEELQAEIAEFEKDIAALKKWVEGKT